MEFLSSDNIKCNTAKWSLVDRAVNQFIHGNLAPGRPSARLREVPCEYVTYARHIPTHTGPPCLHNEGQPIQANRYMERYTKHIPV